MFSYLSPYLTSHSAYTLQDIEHAEQKVGQRFPTCLRAFFLEIGAGYFPLKNERLVRDFSGIILPPWVIAEFMCGNFFPGMRADQPEICFFAEEICEVHPALENLPFFEVCDSAVFAFFKRLPVRNALSDSSVFSKEVWCLDQKICHSFEEFIFRMHHEGPHHLFPFLPSAGSTCAFKETC